MAQENAKRRMRGAPGVKALIAAASVAGTLAGWALLPSNDPAPIAAANNRPTPQPTVSVPNMETQPQDNIQKALPTATPVPPSSGSDLPQIQLPQNNSSLPMPFTSTHSSR